MIQAGIRRSSGVMSDLARLTKRLASLMSNPPVVLPVTVAGHEILILKIFTCIEYIKKTIIFLYPCPNSVKLLILNPDKHKKFKPLLFQI